MVHAPTMTDTTAPPKSSPDEYDESSSSSSNEPDPKGIGREFVRQYYTMLADKPKALYRFYSNDSTFIHGNSNPEIGQTAIQKKISELNFENCRAKIKKVDSCGSRNGSVVIQVIGLLFFPEPNSVNPKKETEKRFMQTFYLVMQGVKNYYVHNDIFHYVDEVFQDSDSQQTGDGGREIVEGQGLKSEVSEVVPEEPQSQRRSYPPPTAPNTHPPNHPPNPPHFANGSAHPEEVGRMEQLPSQPPPESYGGPLPQRVQPTGQYPADKEHHPPPTQQQHQQQPPTNVHPPPSAMPLSVDPGIAQPSAVPIERNANNMRLSESAQSSSDPPEPHQPEARMCSWAERAARGGRQAPQGNYIGSGGPGVMASHPPFPPNANPPPQQQQPSAPPGQPPPPIEQQQRGGSAEDQPTFGGREEVGGGGQPHVGPPHNFNNPPRGGPPPPHRAVSEKGRCLFVANLPSHLPRPEIQTILRNLFEDKYGGVEEVRLANPKSENNKNIAFVTFETSEKLKHVLNSIPVQQDNRRCIPFPGTDSLMFVEEKRDMIGGGGGRGGRMNTNFRDGFRPGPRNDRPPRNSDQMGGGGRGGGQPRSTGGGRGGGGGGRRDGGRVSGGGVFPNQGGGRPPVQGGFQRP